MTLAFEILWLVFAGILVISALTFGIILLIARRVARPVEDPAFVELKRRLAAGEIDPTEYEVRLRALRHPD